MNQKKVQHNTTHEYPSENDLKMVARLLSPREEEFRVLLSSIPDATVRRARIVSPWRFVAMPVGALAFVLLLVVGATHTTIDTTQPVASTITGSRVNDVVALLSEEASDTTYNTSREGVVSSDTSFSELSTSYDF